MEFIAVFFINDTLREQAFLSKEQLNETSRELINYYHYGKRDKKSNHIKKISFS